MSGEQSYLRFEDNKICVTFDLIKNNASNSFMNEIDQLCLKYNILPSVIKDLDYQNRFLKKLTNSQRVFRKIFINLIKKSLQI